MALIGSQIAASHSNMTCLMKVTTVKHHSSSKGVSVNNCLPFSYLVAEVFNNTSSMQRCHISYRIQSHVMKIIILVDIWLQSHFGSALLHVLLMYYKEYIIDWMIALILIIVNVKDLNSDQHVSLMVFDVILTIVHYLLMMLWTIMDIQIITVSSLHMMYVIYLFYFNCIQLLCLYGKFGPSF